MSFNKKRVPEINELMLRHRELGDSYLEQFKSCDALVGSADSLRYLEEAFRSEDPASFDVPAQVLSLLNEAKELLLNRASSKYTEDFYELQKVINSIINKNK
jgi:hypothetical protein